jgi:hypothetical protein
LYIILKKTIFKKILLFLQSLASNTYKLHKIK